MALTKEQREQIIQEVVDEFADKWTDEIQERIDNGTVEEYTDEELIGNSIDPEYANSYTV